MHLKFLTLHLRRQHPLQRFLYQASSGNRKKVKIKKRRIKVKGVYKCSKYSHIDYYGIP